MKVRKLQFITNPTFAVVIQVIFVDLSYSSYFGKYISRKGLISPSVRKHSRAFEISIPERQEVRVCEIRVHHSGIISPSIYRCVMQRCVPSLVLLAEESYPSVDPEDRNVFT